MARKGKAAATAAASDGAQATPSDVAQLVSDARGLTDSLSKYPGSNAVDQLLNELRNKRLFADLAALGTALCKEGSRVTPRTLRLTAQGLIEQGRFVDANEKLDAVIEAGSDPDEVLEAHGLKGRLRKQVYVNRFLRSGKADAALMKRAVDSYLAAFDGNPKRPEWHGINVAALLVRARRDRVRGLPFQRAEEIAAEVRDRLLKRFSDSAGYWDLATLAEANLALGDLDQAELWFNRAAWYRDVKPFELASTLRQLREVWDLNILDVPGSRILPPLDARLVQLGQTRMVSPAAIQGSTSLPLEKVFGNSPFMPFMAWELGFKCAQSVCRVEDKLNQGIGTGFLVPGKLLHKSLPDELLLVTNAHVLSPKGDGESLTAPQAHVSFYGNPQKRGLPFSSKIKKVLWSSPPDKLDVTVARLDKRPAVACELALAPNLPAADSKQKVYVIGHPSGGGLMFSLNDNELLDHGDPNDARVHYRTPTEPGSSGSPVFNSQWELIALHHAGDAAMEKLHGSGKYSANEGIAFKHIATAVKV